MPPFHSPKRTQATLLVSNATVSVTGNVSGQTLRISGLLPEDRIGFASDLTIIGTSIRIGTTAIASFSADKNGKDLVISFNNNATASQVQTPAKPNLPGHQRKADGHSGADIQSRGRHPHRGGDHCSGQRPTDGDLNGSPTGTSISLAYTENAAPKKIAPSATGSGPDQQILMVDCHSSRSTGSTGTSSDQLGIVTNAIVSLNGSNVLINGIAIGAISVGANGAELVVRFNSAATPMALQTLLRQIGYSNSSDDPSHPEPIHLPY